MLRVVHCTIRRESIGKKITMTNRNNTRCFKCYKTAVTNESSPQKVVRVVWALVGSKTGKNTVEKMIIGL